MNITKHNNPRSAGALLLAVMLVIALAALAFNKVPLLAAGPGEPPNGGNPTSCKVGQVATEVMVAAGFGKQQFVVGEDRFNLSLPAVNDAAEGRFAPNSLTSSGKLEEFLNSNSASADAVVGTAKASTGASKESVLNTNNWVGVQMLVPVYWDGNTIFTNGKVASSGVRKSDRGDIGWIFVDPSSCTNGRINVAKVYILRGPCGNPQTAMPRPQRPNGGVGHSPNPTGPNPPNPPNPPTPKKPPMSWQCQQNWHAGCPGTGKWRQDPQNNGTSGSNTGSTSGAPAQPHNPPYQPAPPAGHPAPNSTSGGYNSGGGTGSVPGGSSSNGGTTTGGGHPTPQDSSANSGQGGNN